MFFISYGKNLSENIDVELDAYDKIVLDKITNCLL